jgi:hypothetical protein
MYATLRPDGTPRPVMDLEPHYENTHHFFNVRYLIKYTTDGRALAHSGRLGISDLERGRL